MVRAGNLVGATQGCSKVRYMGRNHMSAMGKDTQSHVLLAHAW